MDKPNDKKPPQGPPANKPPLPPPLAKKPGAPLPKGPVPPRGQMPLPRFPLPGQGSAPGSVPPRPATPSFSVPPQTPSFPPTPGPVPPAAAQLDADLSEAEQAKNQLEKKVGDLEKKLMEEREKVLLASLRSKEEEAVSAKVETSIKDIQDKLRREKKEQELDEARRKAEARVLQMERRLAEERETWVATLKNQMGQRDQITQEMETHFSTRLKDLEYRWAQEKSALENIIRDREADLARVKQEFTLKTEHEKAFWEDRLKTFSTEKEKLERDLERTRDKFQQEREQLLFERQSLRDAVSKLESALKFVEEQARSEKNILKKESETSIDLARQQAAITKENLENQIRLLQTQIQNLSREIDDKSKSVESGRGQISNLQMEISQLKGFYELKDKELETLKKQAIEFENTRLAARSNEERLKDMQPRLDALQNKCREYEMQITSLTNENERARIEYESRLRTLQSRLDWYDSNVKHEYEMARDKVKEEMAAMQRRVEAAEAKSQNIHNLETTVEAIRAERDHVKQELENIKGNWKHTQKEFEAQLKDSQEKLRLEHQKWQRGEDAKAAMETELRQLRNSAQISQTAVQKKHDEIEKLQGALQAEREKNIELQRQLESGKQLLQSKGLDKIADLESTLRDRTHELEEAKAKLKGLKEFSESVDRKQEVFKEKERVLRDSLNEKDQNVAELKARVRALELQANQFNAEQESVREEGKKKLEKLMLVKQQEMDDRLAAQKRELQKIHEEEMEQLRNSLNSAMPMGPDPAMIEDQVRQRLEGELTSQLREKEAQIEGKIKEINDAHRKEIDKVKWENDKLKEDMKRLREARTQIEREAQDLLQQAEEHYRKELEKNTANVRAEYEKKKGLFSSIGKFLDTPLIDTKKNDEPLE